MHGLRIITYNSWGLVVTAIGVVKDSVLMSVNVKYVTVSIPRPIAERIDFFIDELGYWPSRSSFVREACLEKFKREMERLNNMREAGVDPVHYRDRREAGNRGARGSARGSSEEV